MASSAAISSPATPKTACRTRPPGTGVAARDVGKPSSSNATLAIEESALVATGFGAGGGCVRGKTGPLPDLVALPAHPAGGGFPTGFCDAPSPLRYAFVVRNRGAGPAGPSRTRVDRFELGETLTLDTPPLGPGEETTLVFDFGVAAAATPFRVTVDVDDAVTETGEDDNAVESDCGVTAPPSTAGAASKPRVKSQPHRVRRLGVDVAQPARGKTETRVRLTLQRLEKDLTLWRALS